MSRRINVILNMFFVDFHIFNSVYIFRGVLNIYWTKRRLRQKFKAFLNMIFMCFKISHIFIDLSNISRAIWRLRQRIDYIVNMIFHEITYLFNMSHIFTIFDYFLGRKAPAAD